MKKILLAGQFALSEEQKSRLENIANVDIDTDISSKDMLVEKSKGYEESASLISTVHGIFNKKMVLEMVADNRLFGFGFEAEPGSFSSYKGNVWAAPAYAWVTEESMYNSIVQLTDNMIAASKGEFTNRVN